MGKIDGETLIARVPEARGRLVANAMLCNFTWFRVGGPAEVLFVPADEEDLARFLAHCPGEISLSVIGAGSNLLVRDGGVPGVVIKLGRGFSGITAQQGHRICAGTALPDVKVARYALDRDIAGLTFLRGIPGTIGGALRMNGGSYGAETRDVVVRVHAVDRKGRKVTLTPADMAFGYRHCGAPADLIFTAAVFQGEPGDAARIAQDMRAITKARELSQPIRGRTGGSTFKNPPGRKAWRLIDAAGMRGARIGAARVSQQHCNFLINEGGASAADIEALGDKIRKRVYETSGILLEWEIRRLGIPAAAAARETAA
ncbi:MAG: UDP-N-acetylmuramate dehydrogenase [Hyphomicrobiales bacterium]